MAREHQWSKDEKTGQYVHDVSVLTNAPVDKCFMFWSDFEDFPTMMRHIRKVTKTGDNSWHWEADVGGRHAEWDAAMTNYRPNENIAWESTSGLKNSGFVRFTPEAGGCRVMVHLMYDPPYGLIGDLVAERKFNDQFYADLQKDLDDFKRLVESGAEKPYPYAA